MLNTHPKTESLFVFSCLCLFFKQWNQRRRCCYCCSSSFVIVFWQAILPIGSAFYPYMRNSSNDVKRYVEKRRHLNPNNFKIEEWQMVWCVDVLLFRLFLKNDGLLLNNRQLCPVCTTALPHWLYSDCPNAKRKQ